jgi:hypothetical protein
MVLFLSVGIDDLSKHRSPDTVNPGHATYSDHMEETQISRAETAKILGVSVRTVNRYVVAGYLNPIYARLAHGGWAPRFNRAEVEELAHHRKEPLVPKPLCH